MATKMTDVEENRIDEALAVLLGQEKFYEYQRKILESSFDNAICFISEKNGKHEIVVYTDWSDDPGYRVTIDDLIKKEIDSCKGDENRLLSIISTLENAIKKMRESLSEN